MTTNKNIISQVLLRRFVTRDSPYKRERQVLYSNRAPPLRVSRHESRATPLQRFWVRPPEEPGDMVATSTNSKQLTALPETERLDCLDHVDIGLPPTRFASQIGRAGASLICTTCCLHPKRALVFVRGGHGCCMRCGETTQDTDMHLCGCTWGVFARTTDAELHYARVSTLHILTHQQKRSHFRWRRNYSSTNKMMENHALTRTNDFTMVVELTTTWIAPYLGWCLRTTPLPSQF